MNSYEDAAHPVRNHMGTAVHPTCTKCGKEIPGDAYHIGGGVFHVWCHPALPEMACPNCASLRAEVERLTRLANEQIERYQSRLDAALNRAEAAESALARAHDGADRVISDLLIASAPYADMDETGRLPKAREQAERVLNESDLSAKQRYANHYEEQIGFLVERFAEALSSKLRKAEEKYQYQGAWRRAGWASEIREALLRHVDKGDPLDVAAYCAFAWHHGWTLAAPHTSAESALAVAQKRVALLEAGLRQARADMAGHYDDNCPDCIRMEASIDAVLAGKEPGNG